MRTLAVRSLASVLLTTLLSPTWGTSLEIFESTAILDILWTTTATTNPLLVQESFAIETSLSDFLLNELTLNAVDQTVVSTSVRIMDHQYDAAAVQLATLVTLNYVGLQPIPDVAALLIQIHNQSLQRDEYIANLITELVDSQAVAFSVSFRNGGPNANEKAQPKTLYSQDETTKTAADKGLIVAVIIMSMALVGVSSVLLWMSGACPCGAERRERHKRQADLVYGGHEQKSTKDEADEDQASDVQPPSPPRQQERQNDLEELDETEGFETDDDTATNASGFIGAAPNYSIREELSPALGLGVKMTPNYKSRMDESGHLDESEILSPLSTVTDYTEPNGGSLGIASMRKLRKPISPPEMRNDDNGLANLRMQRYS